MVDSFIIPSLGSGNAKDLSPQSLERRRLLAQTMLRRGTDSSPVQAWTQGAARVLDAFMGGRALRQADEGEEKGRGEYRKRLNAALGIAGDDPAAQATSIAPNVESGRGAALDAPAEDKNAPMVLPGAVEATTTPSMSATPSNDFKMPKLQELIALSQDPWADDSSKAVIGAMLAKQMDGPDKPIVINDKLIDPDTYQVLGDFGSSTETFRPLVSMEDRRTFGIPDADKGAYQVGPDNKVDRVGGAGINVNTGPGPTKSVFDEMSTRRDAANAAATALPSFKAAAEALGGDVTLGAGADQRLWLQKAGALMGLPSEAAQNTEVFRSAVAPVVLATVKGLGAGSGISNADREFAEKAAGGNINLEPQSIKRLLDIGYRAAQARVDQYNKTLDMVYPDNIPENAQTRALFGVQVPDLTQSSGLFSIPDAPSSASDAPDARDGSLSGPPQSAIEHLRQNPSLAADFDVKYGPGSAAKILGGN